MLEVCKLEQLQVQNPDQRIFKATATAEVTDRDGEIIRISEFKKTMPTFMDRGAPIMYMHSNKQVGKVLGYDFQKNSEGEDTMVITAKIFKNYELDDTVWKQIKEGSLPGISVGGDYKQKQGNSLKGLEAFEFSVVDRPANQRATMIAANTVAKNTEGEYTYKAGVTDKGRTVYFKARKDDDLEGACWTGYTAEGLKPAGDGSGRMVPNCVPTDKDDKGNIDKGRNVSSKVMTDDNDVDATQKSDVEQLRSELVKVREELQTLKEEDYEDKDKMDEDMTLEDVMSLVRDELGDEVAGMLVDAMKTEEKGDEEDSEPDVDVEMKKSLEKTRQDIEDVREELKKWKEAVKTETPLPKKDLKKETSKEKEKDTFSALDIAKGKTQLDYEAYSAKRNHTDLDSVKKQLEKRKQELQVNE